MMRDWKAYKLGDILKVRHGYAFKGEHFTTANDNQNLLLTPGNFEMSGGIKFNWGKQKFYNGEFPSEYILMKGSLVVAMTDLTQSCDILGAPLIIKDNNYNYLHNQRLGLIVENPALVYKDYLYHYFNSNRYRSRLIASKSGSTVSHTAPERIYDCEIDLPPLNQQKAIASILSVLEDKIELNLQMNKTLEEMAMALYKHWFVDFGPFQNGRFVESELGMIPEGWEVRRLADIFSVKDGTHDSPKQQDEGFYLITSKHVEKNAISFSNAYKISAEDYHKVNLRSKVEAGDILMTMIGTVGVFHLVNQNPTYAIKNLGLFKTSEIPELKEYMYLFFNSNYARRYIEARLAGSTQQYLTLKVLRDFPSLFPSKEVLSRFNSFLGGNFEMIGNNIIQNKTLITLRDTLLPKLISGQIRVKDAEQMVVAAI